MGALEHLQPREVFRFFEEICAIPHGSGHVERISDYLKHFADERGLYCVQDALHNIIIVKEASAGYEREEPLILQGHMDMVAVSRPGSGIDMTKDSLALYVEDGRIRARDTSLGGDDGIGAAYIMALLDADDIPHPRLEAVLTVDEETGMDGARGIDLSMLQGKNLINLDQEEEGVILTSCAGGARVDVGITLTPESLPAQEAAQKALLEVEIAGLLGGHSGIEIDKGRGNANRLLGELLLGLAERFGIGLAAFAGGVADNAIPRQAAADIVADAAQQAQIMDWLRQQETQIRRRLGDNDPGVHVTCRQKGALTPETVCYGAAEAKRAMGCLCALPNGVTAMSRELEGLVETSLNLGVAALQDGCLTLSYAVRSSVDAEKEALCCRMEQTAAQWGADARVRNSYPGWAYRKDSPLRDRAVEVYRRMYGREPVLQAIHAGVECGILAAKIDGLDCISIGPDMADVHTAEESLDITSVRRTWEYLVAVISEKNRKKRRA